MPICVYVSAAVAVIYAVVSAACKPWQTLCSHFILLSFDALLAYFYELLMLIVNTFDYEL